MGRARGPATASPEQRRNPSVAGGATAPASCAGPLASPASNAAAGEDASSVSFVGFQPRSKSPSRQSQNTRAPALCSPSRSGMPSRNELAAEQGGRDETGRDARARRRRSPHRSRGFSPSHGDGAHGGNQETGRRPTRPGSTQRPAALCRDETGACGNAGTSRSRRSRAPSSCVPASRVRRGVAGPARGGPWTVFVRRPGWTVLGLPSGPGAILSRRMVPVRLGSDLAGLSGRFLFGLRQVLGPVR